MNTPSIFPQLEYVVVIVVVNLVIVVVDVCVVIVAAVGTINATVLLLVLGQLFCISNLGGFTSLRLI